MASSMDDDYLWERSGADEDVARLERLLAAYAAPPAELLPRLAVTAHVAPTPIPWRSWLAAAAVLVMAVGIARQAQPPATAGDPWRVARVEGTPTQAAAPLGRHSAVVPGRWIETDEASTAVMFVGRIGRLEIAPRSRLRLLTDAPGDHRAELVRGTIEAQIWAPPGQFVIDTPSATAVDLGCAYTLTIDDDGVGLITVLGGWVGFEHKGREAFIPAGATGRTWPGRGPGTPTYTDAPAALHEAVDAIDRTDAVDAQAAPLSVVLAQARPQDALTLWHLLDRVHPALVPRVVDRLDALVPMPDDVTREGILRGDRRMRDAWWTALGLGSADWWRTWRQRYGE